MLIIKLVALKKDSLEISQAKENTVYCKVPGRPLALSFNVTDTIGSEEAIEKTNSGGKLSDFPVTTKVQTTIKKKLPSKGKVLKLLS